MNFLIKLLLVLIISLTLFGCVSAQNENGEKEQKQGFIFNDVPLKIDKKARYLFYLHGKIVEADNIRPVSEKFGVFEYEKILETFKSDGFTVISEARPKDTDIEEYGKKVTRQIRKLIDAGVKPKQITVVGASQGSWIAMLVSTYSKNKNLNFVILAGCNKSIFPKVTLYGNVLSIYERSDGTGTCKEFRANSTNIKNYKEIELDTGLEHGFIYRPLKEWIEPTIAWARR